MSKNVAVFVDVANIFYAAKAAGVDIDYVTLLKSASAGRDLVRAYAYTGLDPENENQRNFHDFLRRHGYRVVSKDIRKYGDGKVKANLDIELVVDMMKTARNLDIAIIVSGDGDFAPAIRAVQEQGVRVEVISFRGNTSSDLIDAADQFTDITSLAKVERDSTRSGRRVADDEHDLSMTEVPDKLTEGTGAARGRGGRARGRGRAGEATAPSRRAASTTATMPAAALAAPAGGRTSGLAAAGPVVAGPVAAGAGMVVLPGEKLSRVATAPVGALVAPDDELEDEGALAAFGPDRSGGATASNGDPADGGADASRRRRRRGGRGRGRGRGAGEDAGETYAAAGPAEDDRDGPAYTPRSGGSTAFGSVWDSQIGTPSKQSLPAPSDDEDFDEPAIPEYLIAERRQRGAVGGPGRGGRGGGRGTGRSGAYAAFVERERYGRGGGGGINRYPDVSARERAPREPLPPRLDRPRLGSGDPAEPWSEVPPELEALLRAQLAARPKESAAPGPDAGSRGRAPRRGRQIETQSGESDALLPAAAAGSVPPASAPVRGRSRRTSGSETTSPAVEAATSATAAGAVSDDDAVKPRAVVRRRSAGSSAERADSSPAPSAAVEVESEAPRRRRTTTRAAASEAPADGSPDVAETAPATTRRRGRTVAKGATSDEAAEAMGAEAATPSRRRQSTRRPDATVSGGETPTEETGSSRRRTTRTAADGTST